MKKAQFSSRWMPYALLVPQMAIIVVFFIWPAAEAIRSSFYLEDPFFGTGTFVGLDNYTNVLTDPRYRQVALFTAGFTAAVVLISLSLGLWFANAADRVLRGQTAYKTLLMWVYAIAPPVAGLMGAMLFDQHVGMLSDLAARAGWEMQVGVDYWDTAVAITLVSAWKQVPYNFIFYLSALQSIPTSVKEAAAIDCRSPMRRFWTISFPLLAPMTFFLMILDTTYALFETFGTVDLMVQNQPGNSPVTLVYKVYRDGFRGQDLGGSSAQSVILMLLVLILTIAQFRFIERRVHYT